MFLGVQIPLSDGRHLLGTDANRLARPSFFSPRQEEFIRGFGAMQVRRRGGVRGLDFEGNYCNAANLLRFPVPLSRQILFTQNGAFEPICLYRRFLSDGMNVGRFELGFRNKNRARNFRGHDCTTLIGSLLKLKIRVTSRNGQFPDHELGQCGEDLARYYVQSTTKVEHKVLPRTRPLWVTAGRPLLLMEYTLKEVRQASRSAFLVRRFAQAGFALYRDHIIYRGSLVGIWVIEFDGRIDLLATRDLRICLSRLHAERECLRQALGLVTQEKTRSALALTGDAFRNYLKHATGLLVRRRYYGVEQSDILEAAQDFDALLSPGDRETILRELQKIEVGREVLRELEQLTMPPKYSAEKITVFELGSKQEVAMRDINKVGQGVAGANAHLHDNVFQQTWNQAGGNINLNQLADELSIVRAEMKKHSSTADHDMAVGEVAAAEAAARKGDGPTALQRLKSAGVWVFDIAEQVGVGVAIEAAKVALGL